MGTIFYSDRGSQVHLREDEAWLRGWASAQSFSAARQARRQRLEARAAFVLKKESFITHILPQGWRPGSNVRLHRAVYNRRGFKNPWAILAS